MFRRTILPLSFIFLSPRTLFIPPPFQSPFDYLSHPHEIFLLYKDHLFSYLLV